MDKAHVPAKRGQYVVAPVKTYVCISDIPADEREKRGIRDSASGIVYTTVYRIAKVTSVTRDGIVKECVYTDGTAQTPYTIKAPHGAMIIPEGYALPRESQEYLTLDQVRAAVLAAQVS